MLFAVALGAAVADYFLIEPNRNKKQFCLAIDEYFSEAKDGLYKNAGGNIHFGIIAGKTLNKGELNLKLGMITTEQLNLVLVSYYAQIGYRISF